MQVNSIVIIFVYLTDIYFAVTVFKDSIVRIKLLSDRFHPFYHMKNRIENENFSK